MAVNKSDEILIYHFGTMLNKIVNNPDNYTLYNYLKEINSVLILIEERRRAVFDEVVRIGL